MKDPSIFLDQIPSNVERPRLGFIFGDAQRRKAVHTNAAPIIPPVRPTMNFMSRLTNTV
jgi:hypothetical protein